MATMIGFLLLGDEHPEHLAHYLSARRWQITKLLRFDNSIYR